MPDGVCQNSITMSLPCQYVPLHQWDLGKALELTVTQGNSLARAFRLSLSRRRNGKTREGKKETNSDSILSVIVAFQLVSSVVFLPLWAQYHNLFFWFLPKSFMSDFSEDGFLNSKMVALELISNSSGSGLYKSTAKYDHSLYISTCMSCIHSLVKVVELFCRLKSQRDPSLFNLLTSVGLEPYWWSFQLI